MAFIALFLIFRFVSISNNISLQRGIVRSVSATEHNDIVIELENDSSVSYTHLTLPTKLEV